MRFEGIDLEGSALTARASGTLVLDDGSGHIERHGVRTGESVRCRDGERVARGALLYWRAPWPSVLVAEVPPGCAYTVEFVGLYENGGMIEDLNPMTGMVCWVVSDRAVDPALRLNPVGDPSRPSVTIALVAGARLHCFDHQEVQQGALLAEVSSRNGVDHHGPGALRLNDLLAGRRADPHKALLAPVSGQVGLIAWTNLTLNAPSQSVVVSLPSRQHRFCVREGDWVYAGGALTDGERDHQELAKILGPLEFGDHLTQEIYEVYAMRGVILRRNQIELLVRRLLSRAEITDAGDSLYFQGELVDRDAVMEINHALIAQGRRPALFEVRFTGLGVAATRARVGRR